MNEKLRAVAKDIINIKLDDKASVADMRKRFFRIMRKHGIKRGTPSEDGKGIICDNPEWTMAKSIFLDTINSHLNLSFLLGDIPKDLQK